ncbi:MAG: hypothetical protein DRP84_02370 [Spirochaetes bacterium]|nr:MAG: hypothetical protein DRP84_02370 [Spirochaetota bacterium]
MSEIRKPFASIMQTVVILMLLLSMILVAQQISIKIYKFGLIMLIISVILQIGFGNIPPTANFTKSIKLLLIIFAIIISVFLLGIILAPVFVKFVMGG